MQICVLNNREVYGWFYVPEVQAPNYMIWKVMNWKSPLSNWLLTLSVDSYPIQVNIGKFTRAAKFDNGRLLERFLLIGSA